MNRRHGNDMGDVPDAVRSFVNEYRVQFFGGYLQREGLPSVYARWVGERIVHVVHEAWEANGLAGGF